MMGKYDAIVQQGWNEHVSAEPRPDNWVIASVPLRQELAAVLNRHSVENASGTPDFVLAGYLLDCLAAWDTAVGRRDKWYGVDMSGDPDPKVNAGSEQ
jgi:hypothetical protein